MYRIVLLNVVLCIESFLSLKEKGECKFKKNANRVLL